jgi:hypothetical protein
MPKDNAETISRSYYRVEAECNDHQFSTCVLIFRHIQLFLYVSINVTMVWTGNTID